MKKEINKTNVSNIQSLQELIKTPKKIGNSKIKKAIGLYKGVKEKDIIMALGPAGTGKSFFSSLSSNYIINGKKS